MEKITSFSSLDLSKTYTYADYLTWWFDEQIELIKGKIFKMSPAPNTRHQRILWGIQHAISNKIVNKKCKLFFAPFDVRFPKNNTKGDETIYDVVQPDICIICDDKKLDEKGCLGAPDLIVEILSPSTSKKDLTDKYQLYEENGVNEYWIVYPGEELVSVYSLNNGEYHLSQTYTNEDILRSILFEGLELNMGEIFEA
ncbi:MAG: Uma2 family endonuclease [Bacteroidota bacterium]|nr:Uma2 family endonuclease [Bacteroidota bacterium]